MAPLLDIAITAVGRAASAIPTDYRAMAYLAGRGLTAATAASMHVHTGRALAGGGVVPDPTGNILCFPFIDGGKVVNCKYQGPRPDRARSVAKGAPLIFYGLDQARALHVKRPREPLVITEGEVDCLTALDSGYIAVSVPNGAPPGDKPISYDPPEGEEEDRGFAYLRRDLKFLEEFSEVIIAADGDKPGQRLRDELARRIGRARARHVVYPEGCKDLNDVLCKAGGRAVTTAIEDAPQFPLRGLQLFSDYADEEPILPYLTGIGRLDEVLRPHLGSLMVVTGTPGAGKSTFVIDMVASMARDHGWPVAVASFEMRARRNHDMFVAAYANSPMLRREADSMVLAKAERWAAQNLVFIDPRDWDVPITVDWICQRIVEAVRRYGIRIAVIDPWGDIDHPRNYAGTITTDYIGQSIKQLRRVAFDLELLVILVAHPTKLGRDETATLYDISGSAHFKNKTDFGLIIHRPRELHEAAIIIVEKVRYQPETGHPGEVQLQYNPATGKYF